MMRRDGAPERTGAHRVQRRCEEVFPRFHGNDGGFGRGRLRAPPVSRATAVLPTLSGVLVCAISGLVVPDEDCDEGRHTPALARSAFNEPA